MSKIQSLVLYTFFTLVIFAIVVLATAQAAQAQIWFSLSEHHNNNNNYGGGLQLLDNNNDDHVKRSIDKAITGNIIKKQEQSMALIMTIT